MNRIPSKSRKIKSHTVKRPKISKEHQQRIQKLRQSSFNTPLVVKGNEVENQFLNAMSQLGINSTNDIAANNCANEIVYWG